MTNYATVENEKGLVRDTNSKAILSTNLEERNAFLAQREEKVSISEIRKQIVLLSEDITEIKSLVRILTNCSCHNK
jgi:hypothetical protein